MCKPVTASHASSVIHLEMIVFVLVADACDHQIVFCQREQLE